MADVYILPYQLPPEGTSTTQSVQLITKLMNIVKTTPGVNHFAALSGLNILNSSSTSNNGTIFCMLKPWDERTDPRQQVLAKPGIVEIMKQRFAEAGIKNANVVVIPHSTFLYGVLVRQPVSVCK